MSDSTDRVVETFEITELSSAGMLDDIQTAAFCAAIAHQPSYSFTEDASVILEWITNQRKDDADNGRA